MKTTIDIAEPVLQEVRKLAARRGVTLRELFEEGLRQILAREGEVRPFKLRKATFAGEGLAPEAAGLSWEALRKLAYEGRGA